MSRWEVKWSVVERGDKARTLASGAIVKDGDKEALNSELLELLKMVWPELTAHTTREYHLLFTPLT